MIHCPHACGGVPKTPKQLRSELLYLPDNPRVKKYSELTYNNKIDALTIFNDEFDAFHTFVENLMKHLGIPEMEHQYGMGHSNQTVENFTEGECMALFQAKKEVICLYCGIKNEKNAAALSTNKLPLKYNKLIFSIG